MNTRTFPLFLILGGLGLAVTPGCQRQEEIRHYRVLKPEVLAEVNKNEVSASAPVAKSKVIAEKDRMLGAIIPYGDSFWFLKLVGPKDAVAAKAEGFLNFVKSVHFNAAEESKPEWTLPDGWNQKPASAMRYATIEVPSDDKPLELSVITLPKQSDETKDILLNVNRWRGQLQLPEIRSTDLAAQTREVELDGGTATIVNLVGELAPSTMGQPPFSRRGR